MKRIESPSKPVELPDARHLSELFDEMRPIEDLSKTTDRKPGEYFCSARSVKGWWNVRPSAAVRQIIDHMSKELGLAFEIVVRDTGTALVTISYNQIIGGRWVAIIDAAKVHTARDVGMGWIS